MQVWGVSAKFQRGRARRPGTLPRLMVESHTRHRGQESYSVSQARTDLAQDSPVGGCGRW